MPKQCKKGKSMKSDTTKETKTTQILTLIILVFAINEFITPLIIIFRQGYVPEFFLNYSVATCYFFYLYAGLRQIIGEPKLSFLGSAILIIGILFIISALDLVKFKNWARKTMVFCLCFLFIGWMYIYLSGFRMDVSYFLALWWLKPLILLYPIIYLTRPEVRRQFK